MSKLTLTDNQKKFYDAVKQIIRNSNRYSFNVLEKCLLIDKLEENPPLFFLKKKQIHTNIEFLIENKKLHQVELKKIIYVSFTHDSEEIIKKFEEIKQKQNEIKEKRKNEIRKHEERYATFKSLPDESQKKISKITNLERKIRRDIEMLEITKDLNKKYKNSDKEMISVEKKIEENKIRLNSYINNVNEDEKRVLCSFLLNLKK